jgi:hypothetical protein
VDLGHGFVEPCGRRGDEGDLERPGGHHHLASANDLVGGVDVEPVRDALQGSDASIRPDGQVGGGRVGLHVVGDLVSSRIGVGRGGERHAGQAAVLRRGEQPQRVPPVAPGVPKCRARVEHQEAHVLLAQVPGHGQPGLAAPDDDHVERCIV